MATKRETRMEHKAACKKLDHLMQDGVQAGCNGPLPEMTELYRRLTIIRQMLSGATRLLSKRANKVRIPTVNAPGSRSFGVLTRTLPLAPSKLRLTWS
jgi:hypothetical protein